MSAQQATIFYCDIKPGSTYKNGRFEILMHVHSLKTVGIELSEATTESDFQRLITENKVDRVMFYFGGFPRCAVAVEKAAPHIRRLIRQSNR